MKTLLLSISMMLSMILGTNIVQANASRPTANLNEKGIIVSETFKVYGNCNMCKETIETAVMSIKGVKKAEWDKDSKIIEVIFNNGKTSLDAIKKKIAEVGYDTDEYQSTDETYGNLPGCCQYERAVKK